MLRLSNITKRYTAGDTVVNALKGISISFRKTEFVSILGPSGCGKTTTLNIIGGLDKYTDGDLFINGVSTKLFKDRDWDVYRNHRVGFIFQSYNLIPHQTILGNVELALTISGVGKKERQERAKKALDKVGLAGQYHKKPNQLSGGQCQRVAIARALVNEPEILLADEPTGALDTKTSIQIMDLIKQIAKERLVIMVTHNPDLATQYSTRIVRLLDGNIVEDTNPFAEEDEIKECEKLKKEEEARLAKLERKKAKEKAKMSLFTAFRLSARNLYSKFKRTAMVAFAGSIGIVGVSTVLAVSNGVQGYIANMENDMLSGYPVYITSSTLDYSSMLSGTSNSSVTDNTNPNGDTSKAYINSLVNTLANMNGVTSTNEINQEYLDFIEDMPSKDCALVKYNYGDLIAPNIYTSFDAIGSGKHTMSVAAIQAYYASVLSNVEEFSDYASMISSVTVMTEMPSSYQYISNQYDVLYMEDGYSLEDVLSDESSLVAVVSKSKNTLNDLELAEYGYFSQEQFLNYCYKVGGSDKYNDSPLLALPESIEYEDLGKKKFTWYPNDTVYSQDGSDDYGPKYYASAYSDGYLNSETDASYSSYKRAAFGNVEGSLDLNVKCVLKLKDELSYGCLTSGGLYYTNALTKHIRKYNYDSTICESARDNDNTLYNVELGYKFKFDGDSKTTCESASLNASSTSSIMSYISQFFGSSSSGKKSVVSYSLAALGGAEYPSSIYYYCDDFDQKDLLLAYLDRWNDNELGNLYKVDSNGFYVGETEDEDGKKTTVYYYKDDNSGKYFRVNIDEDGLVTDAKGNRYKLVVDEDGNQGFYLKKPDKYGDAFTIDGQVKINDAISINVYNLLSYTILKDEFLSSNAYYDRMQKLYDTNDYFYYYTDNAGEVNYLMKVQNQNYYKVNLDKDGNLVATENGYEKYYLDQEDGKFYQDVYEEIKEPDALGIPQGTGKYQIVKKSIDDLGVSKEDLYASTDAVSYANVSKNPTYTINSGFESLDGDYTLDTKGYYIDITSLEDFDSNSLEIDNENKTITIKDYSKFSFYYLDTDDMDYSYYSVDIERTEDGDFLQGSDISSYLTSYNLDNVDLSNYISDQYYINEDGSLRAVSDDYEEDPLTVNQILSKNILGEELTDLSKLTIDDGLKITYTDSIGIIMSMVNNLINIITYALVAFTALSLVVSTVMIGIITYVSVVERIKEIGVIRSLGGRKRDVSNLFTAETVMLGLGAGIVGIALTYLISLIINLALYNLIGFNICTLPIPTALIMILISVVLTLIAGVAPANAAAKKDPVVALRTE